MKRPSEFSDAKAKKYRSSIGNKMDPSGAADDTKKCGSSPFSETRPANHLNSREIEKYTSGTENDSLIVTLDELEFEIEKARLDIFSHFENMKIQMFNDDKVVAREIEVWTQGGLANIRGGKTPQNEFFIKSLIDNFEEIIGNISLESKRDVDHTKADIRKILVKLTNRIEKSCRPRPYVDAGRVLRRDIVTYLSLGLWSLVGAALTCIFPDYKLETFESSVAFCQSIILIVILSSMFYFLSLYLNNVHII